MSYHVACEGQHPTVLTGVQKLMCARAMVRWKMKLDESAVSADIFSDQKGKPYEPNEIQMFTLRTAPGM
jgi:hypothetical protein